MTSDIANQRRFTDAVKALLALEGGGHQARLAGGCVRDRLMGLVPVDYDIATDALPDAVSQLFVARGMRVVPTGIEHGTVTLVMASGPVEITTLRADVETDGRHAKVAFAKTFEEDGARRDFTINAMYEDARGTVFDFFGGQADLDAKILRFVGDASARIREDYLRCLRLFRFWARFGFSPASGTLDAIKGERDGLNRLSQERLTSELMLTLAGRHLTAPLQAMSDTGVLAIVLPEIAGRWPAAAQLLPPPLPSVTVPKERALALLVWLMAAGKAPKIELKTAAEMAQRLRLANQDGKALKAALTVHDALDHGINDTADALLIVDACDQAAGEGAYARWVAPALATFVNTEAGKQLARINIEEATHGHRRHAVWPIDGHWLKAQGFGDGPQLGVHLTRLKRDFFNGLWSTPEGAARLLKTRP